MGGLSRHDTFSYFNMNFERLYVPSGFGWAPCVWACGPQGGEALTLGGGDRSKKDA